PAQATTDHPRRRCAVAERADLAPGLVAELAGHCLPAEVAADRAVGPHSHAERLESGHLIGLAAIENLPLTDGVASLDTQAVAVRELPAQQHERGWRSALSRTEWLD